MMNCRKWAGFRLKGVVGREFSWALQWGYRRVNGGVALEVWCGYYTLYNNLSFLI